MWVLTLSCLNLKKLKNMNLIRLNSVGSLFDIEDNQVYPQLVDGLPDLGMGVDMYDVDIEWISSLSDEDKEKIMKFIK